MGADGYAGSFFANLPTYTPPAPTLTVPEAALRYLDMGLSVLPVGDDKRPLVSRWKQLQVSQPSHTQVTEWYRRWPNAGVAIVCGAVSNLVVLDIEHDHLADVDLGWLAENPPACMSKRGGMHLYFRAPGTPTRAWNERGVHFGDLKAEGGYVVAPPSPGYRWMEELGRNVPALPPGVLERVERYAGRTPTLASYAAPPEASRHGVSDPVSTLRNAPDGAFEGAMWPSLAPALERLRQADAGAMDRYPSRSEAIVAFCRYLALLKLDEDLIVDMVLGSPIGRKALLRKDGRAYVLNVLRKMRSHIDAVFPGTIAGVSVAMDDRLCLKVKLDDGRLVQQWVTQGVEPRWGAVVEAFGRSPERGDRAYIELVPGSQPLRIKRFYKIC